MRIFACLNLCSTRFWNLPWGSRRGREGGSRTRGRYRQAGPRRRSKTTNNFPCQCSCWSKGSGDQKCRCRRHIGSNGEILGCARVHIRSREWLRRKASAAWGIRPDGSHQWRILARPAYYLSATSGIASEWCSIAFIGGPGLWTSGSISWWDKW